MTKRAATPAMVAIHSIGVPIDSVAAVGGAAAAADRVGEHGSPQNVMSEVSFTDCRRPRTGVAVGPPY